MAWGRQGPHTNGDAQAQHFDADQRSVADTDRLGIDVADRPAHAWEVDEANAWEPVVADSWEPPTDDQASWSGAGGGESEWARAEGGRAAEPGGAPDRPEQPATPPPAGESTTGDQAGEQAMGPARMALGLASLAAQRMRGGVPAGDGLVTGFGLMRQTATGLVALGQRVLEPASRVAKGAARAAIHGAARLPVAGVPVRVALRSQQWLARSAAQAREQLRAAAAAGGTSETDRGAAGSRLSPETTMDSPHATAEAGEAATGRTR